MVTATERFKIADKVLIVRNSHIGEDTIEEDGHTYGYFDQFVGKTAVLTKFNCINVAGVPCWYTDIPYLGLMLSVCESDMELA